MNMRAQLFLVLAGFLAAAALGLGGVGCAHGQSAEDRQMDELRDEIARVQSDRDRFEQRVNALELEAADSKKGGTPAGAPPPIPSAAPVDETPTPRLRVVTLSPDGSEESRASAETAGAGAGAAAADADDGSPRPTLRIINDGHGAPQIEQTVPDEAPAAPAPRPAAQDAAAARHAYDSALALVNAHHYAEALEAFAAFLVRWPDHPNADNALFWRGECYFAQNDFSNAVLQWQGVLARFPGGNKVPDALLRLGMAEDKLGHHDEARAYWQRLSRDFPRSEAAGRIPQPARTP
jgi:tol-pal system protein YbgF